MDTHALLTQIRPIWFQRILQGIARGADVRINFEQQLDQFYALLEQAIEAGDPDWLEPVLSVWLSAPTQSDLEQGQNNITILLNRMINITIDVTRELLPEKDALELLAVLIPVFTYWIEKAARLEMEARVAYASTELVNAKQQLEHLDRIKSNFISVAAHELKTPLTLVEGYTSMMHDMLKQPDTKQIEDLFAGINTGVQRLHRIINDMIDLSLIDNNLLKLNYQRLKIMHILRLLRIEVQPVLEQRNLTLDIKSFPGSELWIFADTERLFQALLNILNNAIKYTPDNRKIYINGRTLPGFLEITISDTGIGIDPEYQLTIFEKFSQLGKPNLHSSSKTKFKGGGPGLGLPISRGIIEAHGGTIWVESAGFDEQKCPGSTFHILLPNRSEFRKSEHIPALISKPGSQDDIYGPQIS